MTLVLCLGNDVLSDDGVGWKIADALQAADDLPADVEIRRSSLSGFYLLDELTGCDDAVVVDAVKTGCHAAGTVLSFPFDALRSEQGPSPHAVGLPTVVRLGRQSGVPLPERIHIVAVEVADMETVAEGLTPRVAASVSDAVAAVRVVLDRRPDAPQPACAHPDLAPAAPR